MQVFITWCSVVTVAGICNWVGGGATALPVAVANMVGVKARVVSRKQVDVTSF